MMRFVLATLLFLVTCVSNAWQDKITYITGIYTNMHLGTEDVTGVEVSVTYAEKSYFAVVQCAEGAISRPIVVPAIVRPATGEGYPIEFVIPPEQVRDRYVCPAGKFVGVISKEGMKGHFEGTNWPNFLKKGNSYWQETGGI
jgi:hypothetical protein